MVAGGFSLGVDFGTSNTVAVLRWPDGRARPLLFDGSPLLPSAVYAEPGDALIVGRDAVHSARLDPARFEPNPKRRIDEGTVLLGDREVDVADVLAAVLSRVVDEARRTTGGAPFNSTLTCPAGWGSARRGVLSSAATRAGIGGARLIEEPVAAATYFTNVLGRDVPIGSVVVVHDFGAGTFDASVVARTATSFEVLAVEGRGDVGGLDVDAAIVAHLGTRFEKRPEWQRLTSPTTVEERRYRRLLWDDVRVAKERLSRGQTAGFTVPLLGEDVHLTREELEELARPLLEQTVQVTEGALRFAGLAEGRLAGVFLVGGATRMPLVATLLHRALNEPPLALEQPELVVAEGSLFAGVAPLTDEAITLEFAALSAPAHPTPAAPHSTPAHPALPAPHAAPPAPASAPPLGPGSVSVPPYAPAPVSPSPASPVSPPPASRPPVAPARQPVRQGQVATVPLPRSAAPRPHPANVYRSRKRGRRLLVRLFAALVLIAVPLISGYLGFHAAQGTPFWPLSLTW